MANKVMISILLSEDIDDVLGLYQTCMIMIKQAEFNPELPVKIYRDIMKAIEPECKKHINATADKDIKDWNTFIQKVNASIEIMISHLQQ